MQASFGGFWPGLGLICAAFLASPLQAQTDSAPALDTAAVHTLYLNADFEKATAILETGLRGNGALTHQDSVFTFKLLGVMYAANPRTRESGKQFMQRLLAIEPTAMLLDVYANDMIDMIFRNVKADFAADREASPAKMDSADSGDSYRIAGPEPIAEEPKPMFSKTAYWIGGTGALVAVGVVAYLLFSDDEPEKQADHIIVAQ